MNFSSLSLCLCLLLLVLSLKTTTFNRLIFIYTNQYRSCVVISSTGSAIYIQPAPECQKKTKLKNYKPWFGLKNHLVSDLFLLICLKKLNTGFMKKYGLLPPTPTKPNRPKKINQKNIQNHLWILGFWKIVWNVINYWKTINQLIWTEMHFFQ